MKEFYQDIETGQLKPVYLFYGDEAWLMEQALAALQRFIDPQACGWRRELFDGEEAAPWLVAAAAAEGSMFGGLRLVLAKNINWLDKKVAEKKEKKPGKGEKESADETAPLLAYVDNPNPDTCLVLTARGTVDKRRKLVQQIQKKGRLCECATPKGAEKDAWLLNRFRQAGFTAERQAVAYISVSTANLSQMAAEVDKLCLYCADSRRITLADAEAVVAKSSLLTVFELTDAAAAKNAALACSCYRQLLRQGEGEQKIFALLAGQFRNMLLTQDMLKCGYRPADIAASLSLHPFVVEKCSRSCRAFSQRQLIKTLEILLAADIAQKNGQSEMGDMLEMAILRICAM